MCIRDRKEDEGTDNFDQRNEKILRTMVGKLRNIEQVTDQFAHHLSGIILAVIGKRQFFIMLKELLTHIPFHVGTHHMTLIADIIFAQALDHVHQE